MANRLEETKSKLWELKQRVSVMVGQTGKLETMSNMVNIQLEVLNAMYVLTEDVQRIEKELEAKP